MVANLPVWPVSEHAAEARAFGIDDGEELYLALADRVDELVAPAGQLVCTLSTIQDSSRFLSTLALKGYDLRFERVVAMTGRRIRAMEAPAARWLARILTERTKEGRSSVDVVWEEGRPVGTRSNVAALVATRPGIRTAGGSPAGLKY